MDKEMHRVIVRDLDNDKKELRATLAQRDAKIATLTAERDALQKKCDDYGSILSQLGNIDKAAAIAERDALAARVRYLEDKHNRTFICLWCGAELDTGCTPQEAKENPEKVGELIRRCEEHDAHCPNNPLAARLKTACHDWAKDDTAIRDALRPILGAMVDGDANWVPPLVDLVEQVMGRVREVELAVHACESAQ